jgi:hypothetical protein
VYWNWTGYGWSLRQRATVNSYTELLVDEETSHTLSSSNTHRSDQNLTLCPASLTQNGRDYVYWNWTGYGWSLRQRATVNSYTEISLIRRQNI